MEAEKEYKPRTSVGSGRLASYKRAYAKKAKKLALLGCTMEQIAAAFGLSVSTMYRWKDKYKTFREALEAGRMEADGTVAEALFTRATGYTAEEEKAFLYQGNPVYATQTKHVPADVTAASFWLKNRQPELWKDRHEIEHSGSVSLEGALRSLSEDIIDVTPSHEQIDPPPEEEE